MNFKEFKEEFDKLGEELEFSVCDLGYIESFSVKEEDLEYLDDNEKEMIKALNAKFGNAEIIYDERVGRDADIDRKVFKLLDHDLLVGFDGYYSSYDGSNFSDAEWFEAKSKVVTIYVPVKGGED